MLHVPIGLMSMHTLWLRQHNRIAKQLSKITNWDAARIFQEARKIVGAQLQVITYNEFLPLILGDQTVRIILRKLMCFFFLSIPNMITELNGENKALFILNAIPEVAKRNLEKCDDIPSRTDFAILLNLHMNISTFNCFAKISQ